MNRMENMLRKETRELEKTAYRIRDRLKDAPKGNLRIKKKRGYMEYYYVGKADSPGSNGKYVKNKERQLAEKNHRGQIVFAWNSISIRVSVESGWGNYNVS